MLDELVTVLKDVEALVEVVEIGVKVGVVEIGVEEVKGLEEVRTA